MVTDNNLFLLHPVLWQITMWLEVEQIGEFWANKGKGEFSHREILSTDPPKDNYVDPAE